MRTRGHGCWIKEKAFLCRTWILWATEITSIQEVPRVYHVSRKKSEI
jgi:hypothetical protein